MSENSDTGPKDEDADAQAILEPCRRQTKKKKPKRTPAVAGRRRLRNRRQKLPTLAKVEEHLLWTTRWSQSLGRHAVAKRAIDKGTRVLVEEAVAAVAREQFSSVVCLQCFKDIAESRSLQMDAEVPMAYCCAECYRASCVYDDDMAQVFAGLNEIAADSNCDVELVNLIVKLQALKQEETKETEPTEGGMWWSSEDVAGPTVQCGWGDVRGLTRNWEKMNPEWQASVTKACEDIRDKVKGNPRFADVVLSELKDLAATVNTNSHGLGAVGGKNTDLALGLFPALSMFNHSCEPNCCFFGTGHVMTVRAMRDIEADEPLTVSYINLTEPRWLRRQLLEQTRFFTCECSRCSEDIRQSTDRFLEGILCPVAKCSGLLIAGDDKTTYTCLDCGLSFGSQIKSESDRPQQPVGLEAESHASSACEHERHQNNEHAQCCLQGHCNQQVNPDYLPKIEDFQQKKVGKNGKIEGFDPMAIVDSAQNSLACCLQACNERCVKKATTLLENHIRVFGAVLHSSHVCVFDALTPLLNCYQSVDNTKDAIDICQRILHDFDRFLNTSSIEVSNFQKILGDLYRQKMFQPTNSHARHLNRRLAIDAFKKCLANRVICCGPNHPFSEEARECLKACSQHTPL